MAAYCLLKPYSFFLIVKTSTISDDQFSFLSCLQHAEYKLQRCDVTQWTQSLPKWIAENIINEEKVKFCSNWVLFLKISIHTIVINCMFSIQMLNPGYYPNINRYSTMRSAGGNQKGANYIQVQHSYQNSRNSLPWIHFVAWKTCNFYELLKWKKKFQVIKHMDKFVLKLKVHLYSLCLIKTYNFTDQSETKQSDDSKTRYK